MLCWSIVNWVDEMLDGTDGVLLRFGLFSGLPGVQLRSLAYHNEL